MSNKVNISIPAPCHENWHTMTLVEKGKFCTSCQKNITDFTKSSDSQIIEAIHKDTNLCGRFLISQLDRTIEKTSLKRKNWLALATLTSLLSFGMQEIFAQGNPIKIEKTDKKFEFDQTKKKLSQESIITGTINDELGPLSSAQINVKGTNNYVISDFNGTFSIKASLGDILIVTYVGYKTHEEIISTKKEYIINLKSDIITEDQTIIVAGGICIRRTFFGRIFYKIGNLFR
ncbi:hypothetical protein FIA58_013700 [Flavobacterium jejuense]|uniref:TonB-dependent receptor SusC n=1 Tax=Flavobacterium jejuense TaxID=1544455 RepID=A0ABX0IV82_9FLAO|nr:carboxypeptidase-like regulatory domain-containing protein [Flavobacterium jejuense]NHN26734.1 hypothetical protein [Flavobacterium jejuense]